MSATFPLLQEHATRDNKSEPKIVVRQLIAADYKAFRAIRLEALAGPDSQYFGASYEDEANQIDQQWIDRCTGTDGKAVFGKFVDNELVSIMAATEWDGDKTGKTILWGSAYTKPLYRGMHETTDLYKLRLAWSQARTRYKRAIFFIRGGNEISMRIHQKNGAKYLYTKPMRFADGVVAPAHWLSKHLTSVAQAIPMVA